MDLYEAREKIVEELKEIGSLVKIEDYTHNVAKHDRCKATIEPKVSMQWFVKMTEMAKPAIEAVKNGTTKFVPKKFEATYFNWLNNIQDWCISRQLWWGHQIPAYYCDECGEINVDVKTPEKCSKCGSTKLTQDPDTLDTWFSSALWPFSTLGWPEKTEDFETFYPTNTLVTGYDIIFFWVVRMMFSALEQTGEVPFKDIFIHGIVRDSLGRKMSKSLGNGVDPMSVIEEYGCDSLRYFLSTSTSNGQDLRYDEEKIKSTWNFINKLWNATRYALMNIEDIKEINLTNLNTHDKWILTKYNRTIKEVTKFMEKYEFNNAASVLYSFIWDDFCDNYIEMSKFSNTENNTKSILCYVISGILKMLHPFMPFFTEEIYQMFNEGSITVSDWPVVNEKYNFTEASKIDTIFDIITSVRNIRASKNVPNSKKIDLILEVKQEEVKDLINDNLIYLSKFTNYENIIVSLGEVSKGLCVTNVCDSVVVNIPLEALVNIEEELAKANERKAQLNKEIARCEGMLSNQNFLAKAKEEKVNAEKEKLASYRSQLEDVLKLIKELTK